MIPECYCSASLSAIAKPDSDCFFPCSGDIGQTCGGASRIAIYKDPTFSNVSSGAYTGYIFKGCYTEATNGRALALRQTNLGFSNMTVESCLTSCKSQGFSRNASIPTFLVVFIANPRIVAALEYSGECYCDLSLANGAVPTSPVNCNTPCNGNPSQICGGAGYISFYVSPELMETQWCDTSTFQNYSTVSRFSFSHLALLSLF